MDVLFGMASQVAETYGLFAAMFICVIVYVLIKNDQREKRYIEREEKYIGVIEKLSNGFEGLEDIKRDMAQIKKKLWKEG